MSGQLWTRPLKGDPTHSGLSPPPNSHSCRRLVQREQEWAERKLEVELARQQQSLQRRDRCVTP